MCNTIFTMSVIVAASAAGLMAGVYFAFSGFILRALDQLGAAPAADAMNAINKIILRSWFMALFFGSTLLYSALAAVAVLNTDLAGRWLLVTIGVIYVVGMFLVTAALNVPLNDRLAATANDAHSRAEIWAHYRLYWRRWNDLRSLCSLTAMVLSIYYLVRYT